MVIPGKTVFIYGLVGYLLRFIIDISLCVINSFKIGLVIFLNEYSFLMSPVEVYRILETVGDSMV